MPYIEEKANKTGYEGALRGVPGTAYGPTERPNTEGQDAEQVEKLVQGLLSKKERRALNAQEHHALRREWASGNAYNRVDAKRYAITESSDSSYRNH